MTNVDRSALVRELAENYGLNNDALPWHLPALLADVAASHPTEAIVIDSATITERGAELCRLAIDREHGASGTLCTEGDPGVYAHVSALPHHDQWRIIVYRNNEAGGWQNSGERLAWTLADAQEIAGRLVGNDKPATETAPSVSKVELAAELANAYWLSNDEAARHIQRLIGRITRRNGWEATTIDANTLTAGAAELIRRDFDRWYETDATLVDDAGPTTFTRISARRAEHDGWTVQLHSRPDPAMEIGGATTVLHTETAATFAEAHTKAADIARQLNA